jgi:flagellar assembly protein FliH
MGGPMTPGSTAGDSKQPARLLRPFSGPAEPSITAMAWRSVGHQGALPAGASVEIDYFAEVSSLKADPEMQRRLDAARQQGRAEGESSGAQRAAQRLDPVFAGLSAVLSELTQQRPGLRAETEQDTVKLALAIARRVLHRELSADPEALLGLVKAALEKLNGRETHRLRVSPPDAAALEEHRNRIGLPPRVEIAADSSLPRGSAVFETSRGELDASVDIQLVEIERGLIDIMRRRMK